MVVKKIQPTELSANLVFRLKNLYRAKLDEFIAMVDNKREILFVNKKVSQEDIDGFLEVITFPEYWVADNEAKGPFLDYVYRKYGYHTCRDLLDAHTWRMKQKAEQKAKETAKTIIPLIEKQVDSEISVVNYDEALLQQIYCAGYDRKEKTSENIANFGSVYLFYLGYLVGAGALKQDTVSVNENALVASQLF